VLALAKFTDDVGRDSQQIGERRPHQIGVPHAQQPGKHFLSQIVGVVHVVHPPDQEALQVDCMIAKCRSRQSGRRLGIIGPHDDMVPRFEQNPVVRRPTTGFSPENALTVTSRRIRALARAAR